MPPFTTFLARRGLPAVSALAASTTWTSESFSSKCEGSQTAGEDTHEQQYKQQPKPFGMIKETKGSFHKLFPRRQLWQPRVEYPLWDNNWDNQQPPSTGNDELDRQRMRQLRKEGVTRHIILIRHGQYDETQKEDSKRVLTELGRKQAELTGKRLRQMIDANGKFGPCNVKVLRVSNMTRAKETADIIASYLPGVEVAEPDADLNEGRPCHTIPGGRASETTIQRTDEQHARIEAAFQRYFHRAPPPLEEDDDDDDDDSEEQDNDEAVRSKHEFEIVVCHANVIRYFLCRALQLPPEAWLRLCTFNCSLTYLTIRPTGTVSCRMLGDIGHIPYEMNTFSTHAGFNW